MKFSRKEEKFIKENRLNMASRDIANHLGCSKTRILKYLKDNNLSLTKVQGFELRRKKQLGKTTSTPEEDTFLKNNYLKLPEKTLAEKLNRSYSFVHTRLRQLGLVIPKDLIEKRKNTGRFKEGDIPFNKGKKMEDIVSPEAMENIRTTWFKKGNIPHNAFDDDGVISTRKDSRGYEYKWIRISLGEWEALHVHLWKGKHGPIPEDHIIIFKDGNTLNCVLENLEMISRKENMQRNTIMRFPEELRMSMQLIGKLNKQIEKNERQ